MFLLFAGTAIRGARMSGSSVERSKPRIGYGLCRLAAVRRGSIVRITIYGVLAGILASLVAVLVPWLPTSASEQMDRIEFTFWFTTVICIAVFSVVAAVILYSILNFRVPPDDESDGPPIHGHTGLEIVWTAVPAILVTAIAIVSAIVLAKNDDAGPNPIRIASPRSSSPGGSSTRATTKFTSGQLVLPVNETVKLTLRSLDVIHSFWVPRIRAEVGCRARDRDDTRDHAEPDGRVRRSSAPSSAGSATRPMRSGVRVVDRAAVREVRRRPGKAAGGGRRRPARRSSRPPAAAPATRSSLPAPTPQVGPEP